jgi:Icc-related predicted phosphoesterase
VRIAAIGDIHCRVNTQEQVREILDGVNRNADVLVLAGDLTDSGQPAEMEILISELTHLNIPLVAVLGNHDHESDKAEELENMLTKVGVFVLNGTIVKVDGIGFVGTKGFCGGFGKNFVQPFGERALKNFIQTSIDEAIQLENALAKLNCDHKVAVLHYAPIPETLEGEPLEIFPFLGSSRLANAIDRHGVDVIFHGHAHKGSPEGRTPGNIPVFNVCRYVQGQYTEKPYCLYTI